MKKYLIVTSILLLNSCAYLKKITTTEKVENKKFNSYKLVDQTGTFKLDRVKGYTADKKFVIKKKLFDLNKAGKEVEQSITISVPKNVADGVSVIEPEKSESIYWFDGKKYKSIINFDRSRKKITVNLESPDANWNGKKSTTLTNENAVYCFFSQLIECVQRTNFLRLSRKKKVGEMNLFVLWDGFPYFNEQYLQSSSRIISPALFRYLGSTKEGYIKYELEVEEQIIFYFVSRDSHLAKMYWVSQGLSLTASN
jgi:hypothetical protein